MRHKGEHPGLSHIPHLSPNDRVRGCRSSPSLCNSGRLPEQLGKAVGNGKYRGRSPSTSDVWRVGSVSLLFGCFEILAE
jgi:hypothetical protein